MEQRRVLEEFTSTPALLLKEKGVSEDDQTALSKNIQSMNSDVLLGLHELARKMPKDPTKTEEIVWEIVRNGGIF